MEWVGGWVGGWVGVGGVGRWFGWVGVEWRMHTYLVDLRELNVGLCIRGGREGVSQREERRGERGGEDRSIESKKHPSHPPTQRERGNQSTHPPTHPPTHSSRLLYLGDGNGGTDVKAFAKVGPECLLQWVGGWVGEGGRDRKAKAREKRRGGRPRMLPEGVGGWVGGWVEEGTERREGRGERPPTCVLSGWVGRRKANK